MRELSFRSSFLSEVMARRIRYAMIPKLIRWPALAPEITSPKPKVRVSMDIQVF